MSKKHPIDELIESGVIDVMAGDMSAADKAAAIELAHKISDVYVDAFEKLQAAARDPEVLAAIIGRIKTQKNFSVVDWETEGDEIVESEEEGE